MLFRPELPEDRQAIHALHRAAFPSAGEALLVDALRASGELSVSLVAALNDTVIGHVAFSPVTLDRAPFGLGLGPLAVLSEWRRRGVGERLVREGLARCREAGVGVVVVLGDPRYYSRFGFAAARRWLLRDEYHGGEAFQALELAAGAIPASGGLVRYAAAFAALAG